MLPVDVSMTPLESAIKNKRVLFITTKNLGYIRNVQEIRLLKKYASFFDVIGLESDCYLKRILFSWWKLFITDCKKYDLVFLGFSPQLVLPLFFWKFRHNGILIDFFISVYDTLVYDRKIFGRKGIMAFLCKRIDSCTLAKADLIISDTNAQGNYFAKEFGVGRERISTLYLEADSETYFPKEEDKDKRLIGKYVVLYFGSALPLQGIDVIMKAVEKLSDHSEIHFIMIGPVDPKYEISLKKNIDYYRWLSQQELAKKIAQCDLCLAGHFDGMIMKAKRTIPGKAYIYRAMHKPMILGDNEATREIYDESMEGVYFVRMGDPDALARKILELYENGLKWFP